ncbi:MAG: GAP family protein [Actinomycetota bacterium]
MGGLLAQTVPLSFAAAISPLVLMGILAILAKPNSRGHAVAYALGVVAMTVALIGVGLVIVETQKGDTGGPLGSPWAQAVTGVLLILFAVQMVRPKHRTDEEKAAHHRRRLIGPDSSSLVFLAFGVVMMVVNFSTIVVLIAILRNVAQADAPVGDDVVAMAIVAVITSSPAWAPLVLVLAGGQAMADRVARVGQWTNRNAKYLLGVLFLVFGVQDLLKALGH